MKDKEDLKDPKEQEKKEDDGLFPDTSVDVSDKGAITLARPPLKHVMDDTVILFSKKLMGEAQHMIDSGLLPKDIKKPEQVIVIMQKGRELGFPAMASFEHIVVINNKPTLDGVGLITKLREGGVEWETIRDYDTVYNIDGVRKYASDMREAGEAIPEKSPIIDAETIIRFYRPSSMAEKGFRTEDAKFTYKEAQTAGLLDKPGNVWKHYTRTMMWWRAFALGGRRIGGDLTMGMNTPEELDPTGTMYMDASGKVIVTKNR